MPLSSAHPAIVLPLCKLSKKWISSTAIIIGSISPDLEYFYHLKPLRTFGHQFAHAWWFDLLITITLCFIFHNLIRNVLIDYFPPFLKRRFILYKIFNWNEHFFKFFPAIFFSSLIGIYSHLIWDEFTHVGSHVVNAIPFLNTYLFEVFGRKIYICNLLQHISSLGGTFIVIGVILSLPKNQNQIDILNWIRYWFSISLFAILFLLLQIFLKFDKLKLGIPSFSVLVLSLISGFLIGTLFVSVIYKLNNLSN